MKTKHTKGEWKYQINSHTGYSYIIYNDEKNICTDVSDFGRLYNEEEAIANAKLIAAAPELLKAVLALYDWGDEPTQKFADEAIKKATE